MNGIKAVFFDMGNTLLHFHRGRSDEVKDKAGIGYLTEYLKSFNGEIEVRDVEVGFFAAWQDGIRDRLSSYREYPIEDFLNGFLEKYNVKLEKDQCIEAISRYYTEYKRDLYWHEDTCEVLKGLKEKGYKIGIISNTCYYDEVMVECFKIAGMLDYIDAFVFSYGLKIGKPREDIFYCALEKLSVAPHQAVMVGDSYEKDVWPAVKIGMRGILYDEKGTHTGDGENYYKISRLSRVGNIL